MYNKKYLVCMYVCRCARSLPQDPGLVSAYFVGVTYQVRIRDNRGKGFKGGGGGEMHLGNF